MYSVQCALLCTAQCVVHHYLLEVSTVEVLEAAEAGRQQRATRQQEERREELRGRGVVTCFHMLLNISSDGSIHPGGTHLGLNMVLDALK